MRLMKHQDVKGGVVVVQNRYIQLKRTPIQSLMMMMMMHDDEGNDEDEEEEVVASSYIGSTVEPPNKGHFGSAVLSFVERLSSLRE